MGVDHPALVVDDVRGLTAGEVARRAAAGETNAATTRTSRTTGEIIRANVFTRINAIYGVLFVIILSTGYLIDALFGGLIIVNSAVGIVQELRAKRTLERLAIVGQAKPTVRRDGRSVEIPPEEVVLGDVIELGTGDKIVVDGPALSTDALEIDESLLTGESDPVVKQPGDPVLSGSFVVAGSGAYRADKVGKEAYAAKLAAEASKFTLVKSELRTGIDKILKVITYLLIPAGALTVYNQLAGDQALPDALRGMVAALVPMVPEGLVLMTSVALAVGVIRLGKRQCLVQELPAIEGLARVDVVCADKTGTLTENAMRLAEVRELAPGVAAGPALAALAAADPRPNASLQAIGEAYGDDPGWRVSTTMPFSSARKWSGASFGGHGHWVLGAPDVLLPAGEQRAEAERIGARGLRVLLLGRAERVVDAADGPGRIEPIALVLLEQKVREDAKDTLDYFAHQDVKVKVISGDNAVSVGAVAASLDLPGAEHPVDARDLPEDQESLASTLEDRAVFGRVSPAQKRAMVGALQARGHTVAMTGDGVNDVLALKDADIGVAMGAGSPATRAVAQIVLLDNKFATLPHVVAEGRRVIGNIERVSNLFLVKTVYSVLLALMVGVAGVPFPFLPRHVSIAAWFTIGIPAFVLSLAPNNERARSGFVGRVLRMAIPAGVVIAVATFVSYLLVYQGTAATDLDKTQAGTTALITLMTIALWVLGIVARPYALWKVGLITGMTIVTALLFLVPLTQRFFELDPSVASYTLSAFACAAVGIVLVEAAWWLGRRFRT
ncbi:HAD-IC family P-type ATPase [Amycolatopsis sp. H20-H5]|uniref:HAD-IC family P-type ATPase n=1 Tax=Amycolatopsis sp. H20-H5 TaxID=3046309 RepID=UPI002DC05429|nr:HAD-IC family P-type ATPase [Amycolatopsis sp. H20-H5]MEC3979395.1 HAD-IC family P-type ATPase [Amycolatopsis sp. H20-H5]